MLVFRLPLALLLAALLTGCQQEQSAPPIKAGNADPAESKPFLTKNNAGIDHEFYRDISLDAFLKMLPTGSVDSANLNFDKGPQVYALVKVPDQVGKDLSRIHFETTFKTQDGQKIEKHWTAAQGRKSGMAMAVFCVPTSVVDADTKVMRND
jgi:hypothetical protein